MKQAAVTLKLHEMLCQTVNKLLWGMSSHVDTNRTARAWWRLGKCEGGLPVELFYA
jgi:hypothetical protein